MSRPRRADLVDDEFGIPVMLANVPGSGVVVGRKTGSRGGNKNHDARSGKFAKDSKPDDVPDPKPNVDAEAAAAQRRRRDAVRDAAREFPDLVDADIEAFLSGRVEDVSVVDIDAFIRDVRVQRLYDISDVLDGRLRDTQRDVELTADDNWIGTALNGLTDNEVVDVFRRLLYRGHQQESLIDSALRQIKDESRREAIEAALG